MVEESKRQFTVKFEYLTALLSEDLKSDFCTPATPFKACEYLTALTEKMGDRVKLVTDTYIDPVRLKTLYPGIHFECNIAFVDDPTNAHNTFYVS